MTSTDSGRRTFGDAGIVSANGAERAFVSDLDDNVVDVSYLVRVWFRWSWLPVLLALACSYFGYQRLQSFVPMAEATMIVLPSAQGQSQPQGGALGGLAGLGIQLVASPSSVSPFDRLKLVLGSIDLAERLQAKYSLLQRLYASSWDEARQEWKVPDSPEFLRDQERRAFLRRNLWSPPSLESLAGFISGSVRIEPTGGTAFQRLSVSNQDPQFALWILNTVFFEADSLLREKDRAQVLERQAYIERQLATRPMIQVQEALRSQLSAEISRSLTLESDLTPYTATIIEAPHVLRSRTEPNLPLMFGGPMLAGGGITFALITLVALIRRERR